MRRADPLIVLGVLLWAAAPAVATAQEAPSPARPSAPATEAAPEQPAEAPPELDEVQALIERMQEKVRRMNEAASERDRALEFLRKQVEEATALIGETSQTAESMKERAAALQTELADISEDRDVLSTEVSERERLLRALEQRVAALTDMLGLERPDRHALGDSLEALRARLEATLGERDRLAARLEEAERARAELEGRLAALQQDLEAEKRAAAERTAALERELQRERAEKAQRVSALEGEVQERERQLDALREEVDVGRARVRALDEEIARLNLQLARMKDLLVSLEGELQTYDARERDHLARISDLRGQLAEALARKVEELREYRSEFFGRLKRALADRPDIKIVGDRFVLPAELLFPSGSARLEPQGMKELEKLAQTLKEVAATISPDIDWVLRVDGHTDKRPVGPGSPYRSNWELSTARALTVVQFLIDYGIPPERLMAAGFGEYQPADPGDSEEAYRRNRRIEFKLTQR